MHQPRGRGEGCCRVTHLQPRGGDRGEGGACIGPVGQTPRMKLPKSHTYTRESCSNAGRPSPPPHKHSHLPCILPPTHSLVMVDMLESLSSHQVLALA